MSQREQLRALAYSLPGILDGFKNQPRHNHYEVRILGQNPNPGIRVKPFLIQ